jgi:hypothetical protein
MGKVINLDKFRKKTQKKEEDDTTKQRFKDSLDNDAVMRRYGIDKEVNKIHKRIDTINNLMRELERINKGEEK